MQKLGKQVQVGLQCANRDSPFEMRLPAIPFLQEHLELIENDKVYASLCGALTIQVTDSEILGFLAELRELVAKGSRQMVPFFRVARFPMRRLRDNLDAQNAGGPITATLTPLEETTISSLLEHRSFHARGTWDERAWEAADLAIRQLESENAAQVLAQRISVWPDLLEGLLRHLPRLTMLGRADSLSALRSFLQVARERGGSTAVDSAVRDWKLRYRFDVDRGFVTDAGGVGNV
jgi:hypothetical protein